MNYEINSCPTSVSLSAEIQAQAEQMGFIQKIPVKIRSLKPGADE